MIIEHAIREIGVGIEIVDFITIGYYIREEIKAKYKIIFRTDKQPIREQFENHFAH